MERPGIRGVKKQSSEEITSTKSRRMEKKDVLACCVVGLRKVSVNRFVRSNIAMFSVFNLTLKSQWQNVPNAMSFLKLSLFPL